MSTTKENQEANQDPICFITSSRLPPKTSPNGSKHRPLKATLPMSSLLKQSSPLRNRIGSPNHMFDASGLRSPGSAANKSKTANVSVPANIRRTASLDALYMNGYWPRDVHKTLHADKATQTDEDEAEGKFPNIDLLLLCSASTDFDSFEKMRQQRQRLQRYNSRSQTRSPVTADHTLTTSSQTVPRAVPVNIPCKPIFSKPSMRNSVEGLNQEIERLVLKSSSSNNLQSFEKFEDLKFLQQGTPEGHRAPFPEHYRNTKSVNTQTPSALDVCGSCNSSSSPSQGSTSPMIAGHMDTSPSDAGENSSPERENTKMGTSPRLFLVRSPPDGCERVNLKLSTKRNSLGEESLADFPMDSPFVVPCSTFKLQPSQGSAFKILHPSCSSSNKTMLSSQVPSDDRQQDLN